MRISNQEVYLFFQNSVSYEKSIIKKFFAFDDETTEQQKNDIVNDVFKILYKNQIDTRNNSKNLPKLFQNLQLQFWDHYESNEIIDLSYNLSEFIKYLIGIDGLERLFNTNFCNLEWNLFLEIDYEKGKKRNYRDHFVHQAADAYLGYVLIWNTGIIKDIKKLIRSQNNTFTEYVRKSTEKSRRERDTFFKEIGVFLNNSKELIIDKAEDFIFNEIIVKSWFIASLFHDIGYPVEYYFRICDQLDRYMPYTRIIDSKNRMDFIELQMILADSYLFKNIDNESIKQKFENKDHGVLSAICLLLNFYSTGSIFSLSSENRCSIELAAHAIFNHTNDYKDHEHEFKFSDDPISFLFRFCDDAQEWSRFFANIDDSHNLLLCDKCNKLLRVKDNEKTPKQYSCECAGNSYKKITPFSYKKISRIEVCSKIDLEIEGKKYYFTFNYDLFKQLILTSINIDYSFKRFNDLCKLDIFLYDQADFPDFYLKTFLSNNPIKIKCKIIYDYLKLNVKSDNVEIKKTINYYMPIIEKTSHEYNNRYLMLITNIKYTKWEDIDIVCKEYKEKLGSDLKDKTYDEFKEEIAYQYQEKIDDAYRNEIEKYCESDDFYKDLDVFYELNQILVNNELNCN